MQDGRTRKRKRPEPPTPLPEFLRTHRAALVIETGPEAGKEFELAAAEQVIGRGDHLALRFADEAMSREHAALEVTASGFRVRDLASTNGVHVNGQACLVADLTHGDRVEIGEHVFCYVAEPRQGDGRLWVLDDESDESD